MTATLHELERVEHRVLGAIRCIDATTLAPIDEALDVQAAGARFLRNRSGLYVIAAWTRLEPHAAAFDAPPAAPPIGSESLTIEIRDRRGRYLPRRVTAALPRDAEPAAATDGASLFQPIDVPMYPGASAPVGANWVAVRVAATETGSGDALGGALLRVVADGRVLALGLTDWRGEGLVPVAGVPVTTWSTQPDAVVVSEIAASLECCFDASAGTRTAAADVRAGRPPRLLPLSDPQALEAARASLPQAATPIVLAAGGVVTVAIAVPVP